VSSIDLVFQSRFFSGGKTLEARHTFAGVPIFLYLRIDLAFFRQCGSYIGMTNTIKQYGKLVLILALVLPFIIPNGALAVTTALQATMISPVSTQNYSVLVPVPFGASASGGTAPYAYNWDFGNGTVGSGQSFDKAMPAGTWTVTLTVADFTGATSVVSRQITVNGVAPTPATADLKANGQDSLTGVATSTSITLTWTSANANSCSASGAWSGSKGLNGSETVTSASATGTTQTFILACTGTANTATDNVAVTTTGGTTTPSALVISNLHVTDVTSSSVVVRWTTNRIASSRVLYDTTSHPSISGQVAPNFGYPNSTGVSDTSPRVTEHAVTVTGLSANTTYYFRAISQE